MDPVGLSLARPLALLFLLLLVPLGSDFVSGGEYVIEVNDKRLTLRAQ